MDYVERSTRTYRSDFLEIFRTDIRKDICVSLCMCVCVGGCGCGCGGEGGEAHIHVHVCVGVMKVFYVKALMQLSYSVALLCNTLTSYPGSGADLGWWAQR